MKLSIIETGERDELHLETGKNRFVATIDHNTENFPVAFDMARETLARNVETTEPESLEKATALLMRVHLDKKAEKTKGGDA